MPAANWVWTPGADEARRGFGRDREIHLPVLVAHRRRVRAGIVEEGIARRLFRTSREVLGLVDAIERGLDDARIVRRPSIRFFSASPFAPPAMLTSVGSQSSDAKMSFLTVPGLMTPGQRMTTGARMPPSQVFIFEPLNGVVPPSGKVNVSAPLSVVNTTIVLSSWPMSSSFFST